MVLLLRNLAAVLLLTVVAAGSSNLSLEQLKARADAASGKDQARFCLDYVHGELDLAVSQFNQGDMEKGQASIAEAVTYAQKGVDAAIASGKLQKQTEIELRKISKRLHDLAEALPFDDRASVQGAVEKIEELRSRLLTSMFGPQAEPKEKP